MVPKLLVLMSLASALLTGGCGSARAQTVAQPPRAPAAPPTAAPAADAAVAPDATLAAAPATRLSPAPEATVAADASNSIAALEPTVATLDPAPAPAEANAPPAQAGPSDPSTTLAEALDAQLLRLIENQPAGSSEALGDDDRRLLGHVMEALVAFRNAARTGTLASAKITPFTNLSERLKDFAPLTIPTLAVCRSVSQFGVYDPFDPPRFVAGRETPVIIYCEIEQFQSRPAGDGRWETKLSYEAVLYTDTASAVSVITKKPTQLVDQCRNKRRDFFLADRMTLPATLPVGRYVLKVTVTDEHANRVAEKVLPILVAPS